MYFDALLTLPQVLAAANRPALPLLWWLGPLTAVAALMALRRFLPRWPGVLIVVAGLTLVAWLSGFEDRGGRVVGTLPTEILAFALPRADFEQQQRARLAEVHRLR